MSTIRFFQEEVPKIYSFLHEEYGVTFTTVHDYLITGNKKDIVLYFRFEHGLLFNVEIELKGELGDKAISVPAYRKLGVSAIAQSMDESYKFKVKRIRNIDDLLSKMEEKANILQKYCSDILNGNVSEWERIVNHLLTK